MSVIDLAGQVVGWNRGAERLVGYTVRDIIGKPVATLYTPDDARSGVPEMMMRQAATEGSLRIEVWRVRKSGSRFWASVVLTALHHDGPLVGFGELIDGVSSHSPQDGLGLEGREG